VRHVGHLPRVTVILEAKYYSKIVRGKLCKTTSGNELPVGLKIVCRMLFEERKKWNSVVPCRCVASERTGRNTGKGRCTLSESEVKRLRLNFLQTINLE